MPGTITLLTPVAEPAMPAVPRGPRPATLDGIAFFLNGQPMYEPIAPLLVAAVAERRSVTVRTFRKPRYSSGATPELLDEIARTSRAAVVGLAC